MQFTLARETLLKPLQQVVGVVERRQTMPILSNLLVEVSADNNLLLTSTDLEVEMTAQCALAEGQPGTATVPARKWFEIIRALPDGVNIRGELTADRLLLRAGRSRYTLATLPANDFPILEGIDVVDRLTISESVLRSLMERTAFAMATQDVRYYLNGLLFDLRDARLRCVATDGHRLAMAEAVLPGSQASAKQIILPRKGVQQLMGLLVNDEGEVELELAQNHLRLRRREASFTSKLIDGKFPDYEAVIPIGADQIVEIDRDSLRTALQRAAILSNEKYRGVKLEFSEQTLRIVAHNPEQDEAVEEIEVQTQIHDLAVGFNVSYMLDAIAVLQGQQVRISLRDAQSSCLLEATEDATARYVVMPLRL